MPMLQRVQIHHLPHKTQHLLPERSGVKAERRLQTFHVKLN